MDLLHQLKIKPTFGEENTLEDCFKVHADCMNKLMYKLTNYEGDQTRLLNEVHRMSANVHHISTAIKDYLTKQTGRKQTGRYSSDLQSKVNNIVSGLLK